MKYKRLTHPTVLRRIDPKFQPPRFTQYLHAVARLDDLAQRKFKKRVIHLALRWVLDQPGVGAALRGARKPVGPEFVAPPVAAGAR